jgi:replicative DNA helicase
MTMTFRFLQILFHNTYLFSDIQLTADHFPVEKERDLFMTMREIYKDGGTIDEPVLLQKGFTQKDILDMGNEYEVMTSNWKYREKEIIEMYNRHKIHLLAETIQNDKMSNAAQLIELWQSETALLDNTTGFETRTMKKAVNETYDAIIKRSEKGGSLVGISSGIKHLDDATLGFQDRNLYYIGARPSQGKTALLLNFMANCNVSCGIISAETGYQELTTRLLSMGSGLDIQKVAAGMISTDEQKRLFKCVNSLYEQQAVINDEPNISIDRLCLIARQMVKRHGIKILFIDYLQILNPSQSFKNRPIREIVVHTSKQLKQLARTLDIPVVCAAQLNRSSDEGRPRLSQFSESAQIEQDADVAILIWNENEAESYLLVEKNRNGPTGPIPVSFQKDHLLFSDRYKS